MDAVMNFGVFVKLPDDLRALLHAEEMATEGGREPNIRAMFTVGDEIKVLGSSLALASSFMNKYRLLSDFPQSTQRLLT